MLPTAKKRKSVNKDARALKLLGRTCIPFVFVTTSQNFTFHSHVGIPGTCIYYHVCLVHPSLGWGVESAHQARGPTSPTTFASQSIHACVLYTYFLCKRRKPLASTRPRSCSLRLCGQGNSCATAYSVGESRYQVLRTKRSIAPGITAPFPNPPFVYYST